MRGIELYHVRGNHWNDIGYNFLVDRYGQVFEGRAGGIERNVIGAQAEGFNTGSVGVAVIGNYNVGTVPLVAEKALANLLAWRLDVAHVDSLSTLTWISGGNPKYPRGNAGPAACDLWPSRHGVHVVSGDEALREAARRLRSRSPQSACPSCTRR